MLLRSKASYHLRRQMPHDTFVGFGCASVLSDNFSAVSLASYLRLPWKNHKNPSYCWWMKCTACTASCCCTEVPCVLSMLVLKIKTPRVIERLLGSKPTTVHPKRSIKTVWSHQASCFFPTSGVLLGSARSLSPNDPQRTSGGFPLFRADRFLPQTWNLSLSSTRKAAPKTRQTQRPYGCLTWPVRRIGCTSIGGEKSSKSPRVGHWPRHGGHQTV